MFGGLFQNADQRRDRELRKEYQRLVDSVKQRKRQFRRNLAVNYSLASPGCSFLMSDINPNFIILSPSDESILEGRFIDKFVKSPIYLSDTDNAAAYAAEISKYREATKISDILPLRNMSHEDELWFKSGTFLDSLDIIPKGYVVKTHPIEGILYLGVKRNGRVVCAADIFSEKPVPYFATFLPRALSNFRVTALDQASVLTIEIVTSGYHGRLFEFEFVYDDFHKLDQLGREGFASMLGMTVEFMTASEQIMHDCKGRLGVDDEDERDFHLSMLKQMLPDVVNR